VRHYVYKCDVCNLAMKEIDASSGHEFALSAYDSRSKQFIESIVHPVVVHVCPECGQIKLQSTMIQSSEVR